MPTLVLSPRYTPDSQALWKTALKIGWSVERLHSHSAPNFLRNQQIVFYGEGLFVRVIADQLAIALLEPSLDWLPNLPSGYLQREVRFSTVGNARREQYPAFIKPAGDKSFDARVYKSGDELPQSDAVYDELPVLISEPVTWQSEFRCFVCEGKALTISAYKGPLANRHLEPEALAYCVSVLDNPSIAVPPAFVLDVGLIENRGWAVIEANPAWASGIYECEPHTVLLTLARSCIKHTELSTLDSRWIVE